MDFIDRYGEVKEFRTTPTQFVLEINKGFVNNSRNVSDLIDEINERTILRKVKHLTVSKDNFRIILEK